MLGPKATQARVPSVKMVADPKVLQADRKPTGSVPVVGSRPVAWLSGLLPGNGPQVVGSNAQRAGMAAVRHRRVAAVVGVTRRSSVRRAAVGARRAAAGVRRAVAVAAAVVVHSAAVAVRPIARTTAVGSVVRTTATGVLALVPVVVVLEVVVGSAVVRTVVRHLVGSAGQQCKSCAHPCVRVVPLICRR